MCNPKPVPFILPVFDALKKRSNKCFCSSGEMPIPWSFTFYVRVVSFIPFSSAKAQMVMRKYVLILS